MKHTQREKQRAKKTLHNHCRYTAGRLQLLHQGHKSVFVGGRLSALLPPPAVGKSYCMVAGFSATLHTHTDTRTHTRTHTHTHAHAHAHAHTHTHTHAHTHTHTHRHAHAHAHPHTHNTHRQKTTHTHKQTNTHKTHTHTHTHTPAGWITLASSIANFFQRLDCISLLETLASADAPHCCKLAACRQQNTTYLHQEGSKRLEGL